MPRELLTNGTLATMERGGQAYGLVPGGAVALDGGRIAWCGPADALPGDHAGWPRRDLEGHLVTPAPIDRHTHIVHGGDRAAEFEIRLQGATYEDVARAGGGIVPPSAPPAKRRRTRCSPAPPGRRCAHSGSTTPAGSPRDSGPISRYGTWRTRRSCPTGSDSIRSLNGCSVTRMGAGGEIAGPAPISMTSLLPIL